MAETIISSLSLSLSKWCQKDVLCTLRGTNEET